MGACLSSPVRDRKADPALDVAVPTEPVAGGLTVRRSFMSAGEDDYYDAASDGGAASEVPSTASGGANPSPFAAPGAGDAAYGAQPGLVRGLLGGLWARAAGAAGAVAALLPGGGGGGSATASSQPAAANGLPRPPPPVRAPSQSFAGGGGGANARASFSSASGRPGPPTTPDGAPGVEVRPGVIVPLDAVLEPEPAPSGPLNTLLTSFGHHHGGDGGAGGAHAHAPSHHHLSDHAPPLGCLPSVLGRLGRESVAASPRRYLRTARPPVGASLAASSDFFPGADVDGAYGVAAPGAPPTPGGGTSPRPVEPPGALEQYTAADATSFMVRSLDYMRTKVKAPSGPALYRLLAADLYSFPFKINHIARHLALPPPPRLSPAHAALPPHDRLPPLLVVNIQLPTYAPALLGGPVDGPGHSLVYTFGLPDGWSPPPPGADPCAAFSGPALALARRFIHNGREADGTPTRERLKLIARVANPAQWAVDAPLNAAEARLLNSYNDKPLLTRPQHKFFHGPGYLEVDLDVHQYAFLARRALASFLPRLGTVIFENALVVQGQRPEELPEAVLCAARMVRVDLTAPRPFPAELLSDDGGVGAADVGTATSAGAPLSADVLAAGRGSLLSVGGRRNSSSLAATPQAAAGGGAAGGVALTPPPPPPPQPPPPPPPPPPVVQEQTPPPPARLSSAGHKKKAGRRRSSKGGGGGGKAGRKGSAGAPDVVAAGT